MEDNTIAMKLEVVVIPVSDVDRAKKFYGRLIVTTAEIVDSIS